MKQVAIKMTSKIIQGSESETFIKEAAGQMTEEDGKLRLSYLEDRQVPVKLLLKDDSLIIKRTPDQQNYSLLHFTLGEQQACKYIMNGQQMDLTSTTNRLELTDKSAGTRELRIEYDLFSGLYLIGNYAVTLLFG